MSSKTWKVEEWRAEGVRRFGEHARNWAFQCPVCKRVYTVEEYVAAGGEPGHAYQECIGRVNGKGKKAFEDPAGSNEHGCNYAAYGLLRLGDFVDTGDGTPTSVNPFAPEPVTAGEGTAAAQAGKGGPQP